MIAAAVAKDIAAAPSSTLAPNLTIAVPALLACGTTPASRPMSVPMTVEAAPISRGMTLNRLRKTLLARARPKKLPETLSTENPSLPRVLFRTVPQMLNSCSAKAPMTSQRGSREIARITFDTASKNASIPFAIPGMSDAKFSRAWPRLPKICPNSTRSGTMSDSRPLSFPPAPPAADMS